MQNLRHMRVRELLKRELNEIFRREFPVELGIVSVTEVGVSNDLHSAKVFVSSIGDDKSQQKAFRTVRKSAGKIQFGHCKIKIFFFFDQKELIVVTYK